MDSGASQRYRDAGLSFRPRFTPILRALPAGKTTVTDIVGHSRLTQGAVSQSVALMVQEGLLIRQGVEDGHKSALQLTARGMQLLAALELHWKATFTAIETLEAEVGFPLRLVLERTADALERSGFAERLAHAATDGKDRR